MTLHYNGSAACHLAASLNILQAKADLEGTAGHSILRNPSVTTYRAIGDTLFK
jgi:hypothetical protein